MRHSSSSAPGNLKRRASAGLEQIESAITKSGKGRTPRGSSCVRRTRCALHRRNTEMMPAAR